ncbi:hypothetical protein V5799_025551, partial [Amblyomma americanum]
LQGRLGGITAHTDDSGVPTCAPVLKRRRVTCLAFANRPALSYAFDIFVVNDKVPVSDTVNAFGYAVSVIACFLAVHCIVRFGFRGIVVASGLVFGTSTAVLTVSYSKEETLMRDCLVIVMRAAGSICFTSFISQVAVMTLGVLHSAASVTHWARGARRCSRVGTLTCGWPSRLL